MIPKKALWARKAIVEYMEVISRTSVTALIKREEDNVNSLALKLFAHFKNSEEVDAYLDHIMTYIDNLNDWFKSKDGPRGGRIPYLKLISFANKEERLEGYLFEIGVIKKKKADNLDLAGKNMAEDEDDDFSAFSVSYEGNEYYFIYQKHDVMFFFSAVRRKVVVQLPSGMITSYRKYKKIHVPSREGIKFVGRLSIYKALKESEDTTEAVQAFLIYVRQQRAKDARRNAKKKRMHK